MNKPIEIKHGDQLIARIYPADLTTTNVTFYTDEQEPFQVGLHENSGGDKLDPHTHVMEVKVKEISYIQELIYVQYGQIKLSFYTQDGEHISDHILNEHDSSIITSGGHGVEFVKDSKIFIVKQGPFPGVKHAKIYFGKK